MHLSLIHISLLSEGFYTEQAYATAVVLLLSLIHISPIKGVNPKTDEPTERKASDEEPFSALAFKIMTDPFVGKLCFFRVYSGTAKKGASVYNLSLINIS